MSNESSPESESQQWLRAMGRRIREYRKLRGLTQEKLAEMAKLAPRTIQKIEAGQITILTETVRRIRRALGCRYDDLMPD